MPTSTPARSRFHRFSWAVLAALLAVILWGAYVRASGSGAGCGSHWPTCNGQIIPRSPSAKTIVEFAHRTTSGIAFLLVLVQALWAFRAFPPRNPVRHAAVWTLLLIISEAIVGAGLVIFEQVGVNTSNSRGLWMAGHLMNTFALLAAAVLTMWRSRPRQEGAPCSSPGAAPSWWMPLAVSGAMLAVLLIAMSGAVVALGDTLFRPGTLREGLAQKYAPGAHLFVRLRLVHPVLAACGGLFLLWLTAVIAGRDQTGRLRRLALATATLVLGQLILGLLNLALLAPTGVQILHLLLADLVWMFLVILAAALREDSALSLGVRADFGAAAARADEGEGAQLAPGGR